MSKIFEALHKGQGEAAGVLLPVLKLDDEASIPATSSETAPLSEAPSQAAVPTAAIIAPSPELPMAGFKPRILTLHLEPSSPLLPFENNWNVAEQYRIIRTKLSHNPKHPSMIAVSSACPGDGKSVTAINLAGVLALKNEGDVLLIDADFRRSSIPTQLGLPTSPGLADVLMGTSSLESALIRAEQLDHLYILTAGSTACNPVELLDSAYWRTLCMELRQSFRYIVIDSPPLGIVADSDLLQASSDGVVMVVRPDHSGRAECLRALSSIPKEKLLGVVVNCSEEWFLTKGYRYNSSYYYKK